LGIETGMTDVTPTLITLEIVNAVIQLRVDMPMTQKGFTVIESSPYKTGKSLDGLRKYGAKYAKRFSIKFVDKTVA
jgi:hypothetical protein